MFHLIKASSDSAPFWNGCTEVGVDSTSKILAALSYYVACLMYALTHTGKFLVMSSCNIFTYEGCKYKCDSDTILMPGETGITGGQH